LLWINNKKVISVEIVKKIKLFLLKLNLFFKKKIVIINIYTKEFVCGLNGIKKFKNKPMKEIAIAPVKKVKKLELSLNFLCDRMR
jgi:hypothetical protein